MNVAILHYHLRTGGVTTVIENACRALNEREVSTLVLVGESHAANLPPETTVRVVSGLGYDESTQPSDPAVLAEQLLQIASQHFGAAPDVWHVHNHALGKNLSLPGALLQLATDGHRILLQSHDFAEDGRPANYRRMAEHYGDMFSRNLYPIADHIHYATINGRDHTYLRNAGINGPNLHSLPNAVRVSGAADSNEQDRSRRLFLYPTRAIRRKNLGEFLLWSALADSSDQFAVTRAPRNPAQRPVYDHWVTFAKKLKLPVEFEAGENTHLPFAALMRSAHALVTTSVAEGFGLVYLEPWLVGRPLCGRNLTEITGEITESGIDLSALYERLDVPINLVGEQLLRECLTISMQECFSAYGRQISNDDVDIAFNDVVKNDKMDFGRIDESLQEDVITKIVDSGIVRNEIQPATLFDGNESVVIENAVAVRNHYSIDQYGERLKTILQQVAGSNTGPIDALPANTLLNQFLSPRDIQHVAIMTCVASLFLT